LPLYDYVCRDCGHQMEVMHSVTTTGPAACPVCGGTIRKVIVAPAVHFKGSGWAKVERRASTPGPKTATAEGPSDSSRPDKRDLAGDRVREPGSDSSGAVPRTEGPATGTSPSAGSSDASTGSSTGPTPVAGSSGTGSEG